jgi:hypothetical protein
VGETTKRLSRLFQRKKVVDMATIGSALAGRSRRSLFRDLAQLGYLTSYSHAGRYYTLSGIPPFDEHGLWIFRGIGFSCAGTLKQTVVERVQTADAGHTHVELEHLLRVRVHNTLLGLVRQGQIGRERIDRVYMYVSAQRDRAAEQVARRRQVLAEAAAVAELPGVTVIEVLVEALQAGQVQVAPAVVAARLSARAVSVSVEQVEQVFDRYGVNAGKKTPASGSIRSQD